MKTQISRNGFRPDQRYSGVYQQQGRVLTDRDWNETVDVLKHRIDGGLADVLGTGLPRERPFLITKGPSGLIFQPGTVRVGGIATRIDTTRYEQQADYPSPPPLPTGQVYSLYLDVWDRPVTAAEDPDLRDPALTGAYDTATRTRTLVQVKWAPAGSDAENPAQNPPRGNATLAVKFVGPAGGDSLFRLEVHDVTWPAGAAPAAPSTVVLKWSRENGARQLRYADAAGPFTQGSFVWEVWKPATEAALGWAFGAWAPARGALSPAFPQLSGTAAQESLVRRWDGSCTLTRTGNAWSLASPVTGASMQNGKLVVATGGLELTVDPQGKTFLPGDSWSVPIRQSALQPGAQVSAASEPAGVVHRYATLATVSAAGDVTLRPPVFSIVERLGAGDVRYDGTGATNGLFDATTDTAGKALDRLWQLAAQHLAYAPPASSGIYTGKTVANAKQALDLLADVRASRISTSGRSATPDLQGSLDTLFGRLRPTPWITVGRGGQFATLGEAIGGAIKKSAALGRGESRLWLLPGDHSLAADGMSDVFPGDTLGTSLTLAGGGRTARLLFPSTVVIRDFTALSFHGLSLEFSTPGVFLYLDVDEVSFVKNRISGASKEGLIQVAPGRRLALRDNVVAVTQAGSTPTGTLQVPGTFLSLVEPSPGSFPTSSPLKPLPGRVHLAGNEILGWVSLYGMPGDELSAADRNQITGRMTAITFDPDSQRDLVARNNKMTGFQAGAWPFLQIRKDSLIAPIYRRAVLANNTIDGDTNQLLACTASLDANLFAATAGGWIMADEILAAGNTARAAVTLGTLRKTATLVGNSSRINFQVYG
ncbi:MAG TPA: DUF6519 domain-containing protein [Thermoanaerobaculia bacterium]|nr:DUF6519 domain-containing protein [Thermoanaerobaculia bacterium]